RLINFSLLLLAGLRSLFLPLLNNFLQFIFHRQFARLHTGNICRSGHNMSCNRCCAEQKDNTEKEFDIEVPFNEPKIKEDTCECAIVVTCNDIYLINEFRKSNGSDERHNCNQ